MYALGMCESSWRPHIRHLDSNNYYSYGVFQFQMATWLSYGKKFGATKKNIYNAELQEKVAISMLDKGEFWHWKNCVKKVTKKLGPYPDGGDGV